MNALAPPKKKRRLCGTALRIELAAAYRALTLLQAPFAFLFWLIEERKARLQDRLENERNDL
jgi:hypothetical protein